jgi:hypothetical protein
MGLFERNYLFYQTDESNEGVAAFQQERAPNFRRQGLTRTNTPDLFEKEIPYATAIPGER